MRQILQKKPKISCWEFIWSAFEATNQALQAAEFNDITAQISFVGVRKGSAQFLTRETIKTWYFRSFKDLFSQLCSTITTFERLA